MTMVVKNFTDFFFTFYICSNYVPKLSVTSTHILLKMESSWLDKNMNSFFMLVATMGCINIVSCCYYSFNMLDIHVHHYSSLNCTTHTTYHTPALAPNSHHISPGQNQNGRDPIYVLKTLCRKFQKSYQLLSYPKTFPAHFLSINF